MEIITQKTSKRKRQTKTQNVDYPRKPKQGCSPFIGFVLVFGIMLSLYLLFKTPTSNIPRGFDEENTQQIIPTDKPKKPGTLLFEEVIERNPDGTVDLQPKRKDKLNRDTLNFESSEQYALRATENTYYPCLSCPFRDSIFLYYGEVWKYGTTINGEKGRYGNSLHNQFLQYELQFIGTISECLKQERIKIIRYPMLPENIKRKYPIARPPGNSNDN